MSRDRLLKVVGNSSCLTKRQISDYIRQKLFPEELYVVEMHLNECPFCNDAIEGFSKSQEHFLMLDDITMPDLKAIPTAAPDNKSSAKKTEHPKERSEKKTIVPAALNENHKVKEANKNPFKNDRSHRPWFSWSIAAALLLGFFTFMYYRFGANSPDNKTIIADASNNTVTEESAAELLEPSVSSNAADSMMNDMYGQVPIQETAPVAAAQRAASTAPSSDSALPMQQATVPIAAEAITAPSERTAVAPTAAKTTKTTNEARLASNKASTSKTVDKTNLSESKTANQESEKEVVAKKTTKAETAVKTASRAQTADKVEESKASDSKFERINADYKKGVDLYKKGQYGTALLYLQPSISNKKAPNHKQALNYAAKCHEEMGNNRKAERLREQASKL